jgi:4-hydroxybenzoate polyprenyltransferase
LTEIRGLVTLATVFNFIFSAQRSYFMLAISRSAAMQIKTAPSLDRRLKAYVSLVRPANLVTAGADILAGAVITGGRGRALVCLVTASVCLYAGGVVLNDFFDRKLDAVERPERAIPSGRVPAIAAAILGFALLLLGVMVALQSSRTSAVLALLIAACILLYDIVAKPRAAGPFVMSSCRALNLLLGISIVPDRLSTFGFLALIPMVYIFAITTLSRGEVHGGSRSSARTTLILFGLVVLAVLGTGGTSADRFFRVVPFALLLCFRVGTALVKVYRQPTADLVRAGVHAGVVSLIVLDAALAASFGGVVQGAAILSLAVVAMEFARFFAVT